MQGTTAADKCESSMSTSFPLPSLSQNPLLCPRFHGECHCCGRLQKPAGLVRCQNTDCGLHFCRSCLVRKYKFSKRAAKRLPGDTWQCPKCMNQCFCGKCISESGREFLGLQLKRNKGTGFKRELEDLVALKDKMISQGTQVVRKGKIKPIGRKKCAPRKNVNHENPKVPKRKSKDVRGVEEVKENCTRVKNADTRQIESPPYIASTDLLLVPCTPLNTNFYIKLNNPAPSSGCKQPYALITFGEMQNSAFWQYGYNYLGGFQGGAIGSFA